MMIRVILLTSMLCFGATLATGAESQVPLSRLQAPEVTGSASTASAAASTAAQLAEWWNDLGLKLSIQSALQKRDADVTRMLSETGQPGVLVYIQIERATAEVSVYYLTGDQVELVGAGTSPDDVYFAFIQRDQLEPSVSKGNKVDLERSSFLWFTKAGQSIQAQSIPAEFITYLAYQRKTDQKLRASINATSQARALGAAVDYLEKSTKDKQLRQEIAALKAKQLETNKKIVEIDQNLQKEIERAKRAQAVSMQLETMAGVLTLTAQIVSVSSYLGGDAPTSITDAKTPEELKSGVDTLLSDAITHRDSLEVTYKSQLDQATQQQIQFLSILTKGKIPTADIPQIKRP